MSAVNSTIVEIRMRVAGAVIPAPPTPPGCCLTAQSGLLPSTVQQIARGYMEQPVKQPESAVMAPTFAMCAAA